jgi:hypothetical protein
MKGSLAQAAALAAHAKARAHDLKLGDDAYWNAHSTFQYVKTVRFLDPLRGVVGTTPHAWLETIPRGCLVDLYMTASHEGIAVSTGPSPGTWLPRWEPTGARHPEQKIWRVDYTLSGTPAVPEIASTTLDSARRRLAAILPRVDDFAASNTDFSSWCQTFQNSQALLQSPKPIAPYHPDILPSEGYTLASQQLLAAAVAAYVFGGMGSWNDGEPSSSKARSLYRELSQELWFSVLEGIVTAVNHGFSA